MSQSDQNVGWRAGCRPLRQYHTRGGFEAILGIDGQTMKTNRITVIGLAALIAALLVAIGILWLANASIMPPMQTINQAIPDDRIPH